MRKAIFTFGIFWMLAMTSTASAELWINEFVSAPLSGLSSDEWIEIYADSEQSLDSCYLVEASGAQTFLSGLLYGYMVIENPAGVLNNGDDTIGLYCGTELIDAVSYSGGIPGDGKSLGRNAEGDFVEYDTPTPGEANYAADDGTDDGGDEPVPDLTPTPTPTPESSPSPEPSPTAEPTPDDEPTPSPEPSPEGDFGDDQGSGGENDEEAPSEVPEFGTIGALIVIAGSGLFVMRRKMRART